MVLVDRRGGLIYTPPLPRYVVLPEYEVLSPLDRQWQLARQEGLQEAKRFQVYQTPEIGILPKIRDYQEGKRSWQDVYPQESYGSKPPMTGETYLRICTKEKLAMGWGYNITLPVGLHANDSNVVITPSEELCAQLGFTPSWMGEFNPHALHNLCYDLGNGITQYTKESPHHARTTIGITLGDWKSIGKDGDGPVHIHAATYNTNELRRAKSVPIAQLPPDIYAVSKRNDAGVYTARILRDNMNLETVGLHIHGDKPEILSSGAMKYQVDGNIGTIMAEHGAELCTFLEQWIKTGWQETSVSFHQMTGVPIEYMNQNFCGAYTFRQEAGSDKTTIHIATGLRMDQTKTARGGIFLADSTWSSRTGQADYDFTCGFALRSKALAGAITRGNLNPEYQDVFEKMNTSRAPLPLAA